MVGHGSRDMDRVDDRVVIRRWIFYGTDFQDLRFYLNEHGQEVGEDIAVLWVGSDAEAEMEADRRADLWEKINDAFLSRITLESRGKIIG